MSNIKKILEATNNKGRIRHKSNALPINRNIKDTVFYNIGI
jgi:hypothetical protein